MRKHKEDSLSLTPRKALVYLKEGNERFMSNLRINRNMLQVVNDTANQQYPFCAILSCSDSRISNELVFDQGLGDVFSVRLAGNIASINAIGSMEYTMKVLGSKLIVVMGHTNCGAVKAACEGVELENLTPLLNQIQEGIAASGVPVEERSCDNKEFINKLALNNVFYNMELILQTSNTISELIQSGKADIVGAMYNVNTGKVEFYDKEKNRHIEDEEFNVLAG